MSKTRKETSVIWVRTIDEYTELKFNLTTRRLSVIGTFGPTQVHELDSFLHEVLDHLALTHEQESPHDREKSRETDDNQA